MTIIGLRHGSRGMTLIELMVSLALGVFLTWGAFEVYVRSKSNYRAADALTRLQENTRFALETIEPDLRLTGFWGRHREGGRVERPGAIVVSCDGGDVTDWALDLAVGVAAQDDNYDLDCAAWSEARAASDVLIIRHASERATDPQAGKIQLHTDLTLARLFDDGVVPADFLPTAVTHDLVVHAYYVDNASSFDDGLPSLRRQTLVDGSIVEDQEMITGVENLQVQFGLDTDADGGVERYVDPGSPVLDDTSALFIPAARIVAVRFWLLVRGEESPGADFRDTRTYQPLDLDNAPITPGGAEYPDNFQRIAVTKTVYLRNQGAS